jgi:hypothetical protein
MHADIVDALGWLTRFRGADLAKTVAQLEERVKAKTGGALSETLGDEGISQELLRAAVRVKRAAAQIDQVVHALGMLLSLGELLEADERVEALSLAAGNTGKKFDLETDRRVAEFTFIDWKGGSESIRRQKLFKDFYVLAEADTPKERYLYFLGDVHAPKVFQSRSPYRGMLRKFARLRDEFVARHGPTMTVEEYYGSRKEVVKLRNLEQDAPSASCVFARLAGEAGEVVD